MKYLLLTAIVWIFVLPARGGARQDCSTERIAFRTMGTAAAFSFTGKKTELPELFRIARETFDRISRMANLYDPESELSRLNAQADKAPFRCSEELYELLKEAKNAYAASGGAFDISVKPLMDLWGFYRERDSVPSEKEVRETLNRVGLNKVLFNDRERSVFFTVPGMALDLGGVAKGWAVDRSVDAVSDRLDRGIFNLGGNLRILNRRGRKSTIGIANPLKPETVERTLEVGCRALSTSGGYERFVVLQGKRCAHIMDPATGFPSSKCLAATVMTPLAVQADWMSTAVFIRGESMAEELVRSFPGTTVFLYLESDSPAGFDVRIHSGEK